MRSGGPRFRRTSPTAFRLALAGTLLALAAACGPVPGGRLSGQVAPEPADWAAVVPEKAFCEIEARPADPHSIQLECFLYEGALFVQSHRWALASWWPVRSWAAVWLEHPNVRLRIGDAIYEVVATRVTAAEERDPVLEFRGYDPVPLGIVLFRFTSRARDASTSSINLPGHQKSPQNSVLPS